MTLMRRIWYLIKMFRRVGGVQGMKDIAANTPKYATLLRRLLADPRVPANAKAVLLGAGAFAASPLNIPGFIPVIGALDDIGIALLAWGFFEKRVPADVMREHRRAVGLSDATMA